MDLQTLEIQEAEQNNLIECEDDPQTELSSQPFDPLDRNCNASKQTVHHTVITNILSTTSQNSSFLSSFSMCSNGEQTAINGRLKGTTPKRSHLGHLATKQISNVDTPINGIPPIIMGLFNKPYILDNYYENIKQQTANIKLDYMSNIFRKVDKQFDDKIKEDDNVLITMIAAKHVHKLVESNRQHNDLERELSHKLDYINQLLSSRINQISSKMENINFKQNLL